MSATLFHIEEGDGPLIGAAVHDGHAVRDEVAAIMGLSEPQRLREEDPFTGEWAAVAGTRILGLNSRFEVDLNRPRDKAVYLRPEDAWGLEVWSREPGPDIVERSLARYDAFYTAVDDLLERVLARHGGFVLFDLHTYNHRRDGPGGPTADAAGNPEVNIGTGTLDRGRWGAVVDRFVTGLSGFDFRGRRSANGAGSWSTTPIRSCCRRRKNSADAGAKKPSRNKFDD